MAGAAAASRAAVTAEREANLQTDPARTNPASAEGWAFLEAILQSCSAVSLPRLRCSTLQGETGAVTAGGEMAAAVTVDTHRFCHRCDQLIVSLEAIDRDVPVEPAAAVEPAVASTTAAPADTSAAVKAAAVSAAAVSTAAAVKAAAAAVSTAAAVKAAVVLPATAARVAAATADAVAAVKAVATLAAAAAVKAAAHSGTEAAPSPAAVEFGAGERGEPLVSAHTAPGISAELPSATTTASQHSEGISTGVKPVSASRSEPEQLSQHDAVLHELEAALLELTELVKIGGLLIVTCLSSGGFFTIETWMSVRLRCW